MKKILSIVSLAAITADALLAAPVLDKQQNAFLRSRRIAVSRDTSTIPGSVITTYHRAGKLDSVVTNELHAIVGREQKNPVQHRAEVAEAEAKPLRDLKKSAKRTAKTQAKIVKELEKAKKKADGEEEAAFYESLIGIINDAFEESN